MSRVFPQINGGRVRNTTDCFLIRRIPRRFIEPISQKNIVYLSHFQQIDFFKVSIKSCALIPISFQYCRKFIVCLFHNEDRFRDIAMYLVKFATDISIYFTKNILSTHLTINFCLTVIVNLQAIHFYYT